MNNDTPADAMELKPCPFCGGEAYMHCGEGRHYDVFIVKCDGDSGKRDCAIYPTTGILLPKAEAIAAWNTRTTSLAAQDGLVGALRILAEEIAGIEQSDQEDVKLYLALLYHIQDRIKAALGPLPAPPSDRATSSTRYPFRF